MRPFTVNQILEVLDILSADEHNLSAFEKTLLRRFNKEFGVNVIEHGIQGPWQKKQFSKAVNNIYNPYKLSNDDQLLLWIDWEEYFNRDFQDTISISFFMDRVTIPGKFDNLSFYSRYTLYRVGQTESFPLPEEFKQGYILEENNTCWLVWDVSEAFLRYDNLIMNTEISKILIYWDSVKNIHPFYHSTSNHFHLYSFQKIINKFEHKVLWFHSFLMGITEKVVLRKSILLLIDLNLTSHHL